MPSVTSNNNHNKLTFVVFISLLLFSCHKDKVKSEIEGITNFTWKIYVLKVANDTYISPMPTYCLLNLNNDRSFSITLGNSVSSGNYSWTAIDTASANTVFTFKKWSNPPQYLVTANKLENVVKSANWSFPSNYQFFGIYPGPPLGATMVLQLEGSGGFHYAYR